MEIWRDVVGHEGHYQVSSCGRVRSCDRLIVAGNRWGPGTRKRKGQLMVQATTKDGYKRLGLRKSGVAKKYYSVHRLVMLAFAGPEPAESDQVNHINGDKQDNRLENLEWCDSSHNQKHAYQNGFHALALHRCPDTGRLQPKEKT